MQEDLIPSLAVCSHLTAPSRTFPVVQCGAEIAWNRLTLMRPQVVKNQPPPRPMTRRSLVRCAVLSRGSGLGYRWLLLKTVVILADVQYPAHGPPLLLS